MLEIRLGTPQDFDAVLDFYTKMIDQMKGTEFDVLWEHGVHPSPEFLQTSLERDRVYLGWVYDEISGVEELACALILNSQGAEGYDRVSWDMDVSPDQMGVLHVVATLPKYHGQGFARRLVQATIDAERELGTRTLRLDTFPHNVRGKGLYESVGFVHKGDVVLHYPALGDITLSMYELPLV